MNKLITLICILIVAQIIVYLIWAFIELSFSIPIIETFKTSASRAWYLLFLFAISAISFQIWNNE